MNSNTNELTASSPTDTLTTQIAAVVECVTALAAMTEDPSHFREGPVTAGAVYIRLATKHGIDKGSAHAVSLIESAVAAGLIDAQWAEWTDGGRTTDTILSLKKPETDETTIQTTECARCQEIVMEGTINPDGHLCEACDAAPPAITITKMPTFQCEECDRRFYFAGGGVPTTCDECWAEMCAHPVRPADPRNKPIQTHGPEVKEGA